jgi:hypothetical protein
MAYGMIKKIQEDNPDEFSGILWDLDTWKELSFSNQTGLTEINRLDLVSYTDLDGKATGLRPSVQVRVSEWNQQSPEIQDAVKTLLRVVVKDTRPKIDIVTKKF